MIKSETGTVSMRGTTPVLVSELAFMVKGMRESDINSGGYLAQGI